MKYIADKIENDITLLMSFSKMFSMFQMRFWYDKEHDDQNNAEYVAIGFINCGKETNV